MKKKWYAISALFLGMTVAVADSGMPEWNGKNSFYSWKKQANVKVDVTPEALVLTEIKADPQVISGILAIDPSKYNSFKFRYRATGTGKGGGQLFYARTPGRFSERDMWSIPKLADDGQWHTMILGPDTLVNPKSWTEGGIVVQLRFDPTDSAGGKIEISNMSFCRIDSGKPEWNGKNGFDGWKAHANTKVDITPETLVMSDIKADPQIISGKLAIDPKKYNAFQFRYRATGTGSAGGELYFASKPYTFSAKNYWRIPKLNNDGQWHTMTLTTDALSNPQSWTEAGTIVHLRFDPTNSAGGKIEISEMSFFFNKTTLKKLPPVAMTLDAPVWPKVKPEFLPKDFTVRGEPYFQGKLIKSEFDLPSGGKHKIFFLRREFQCKAKPVLAWLQYTADDEAQVYVNGTEVSRSGNWRITEVAEVSDCIQQGTNTLAFRYHNSVSAGGVLGELLILFDDGTTLRIDTDKNFKSHVNAPKGWNKNGFDDSGWTAVLEQAGPPAPPWTGVKLIYKDYTRPQKFIQASATPKNAVAGNTVRLNYEFEGKMPDQPFGITMELFDRDKLCWSETLPLTAGNMVKMEKNRWKIQLDYTLPLYLNSNKFRARIKSGALHVRNGGFPETGFHFTRAASIPNYTKNPKTSVIDLNGSPSFAIDGKPFYPVWGYPHYVYIPFGQAPLNLITVNPGNGWWSEENKNDFSVFDRFAEGHRRNAKDAYFLWDIPVRPPQDWVERNPDEICLDDKGMVNKDGGHKNYSFGSEKALEAMRQQVINAIRYLEKSPYANRIIGYRISGGHTAEWLGWTPVRGRTLDFSPAAQKAFKKFAQQNYPALKDFHIPTLEERKSLDNNEILWEPSKHLSAIAYNDYYSTAVADMLAELCKTAKAELKNQKVVGSYYGYTVTLHSTGSSQMRAHYALKKLIDSKSVDFLMSPQAYSVRNLGDTCGDMKPFASMAANNIIPVIEDDTRTHNGRYISTSLNNYQTLNKAATLAVMRRNMGIALCRRQPLCYFPLGNGTDFDFPEMVEDIAILRKTGEHCSVKAVKRDAQTAIVFSEDIIKSMPILSQGSGTGKIQVYKGDGTVRQIHAGTIVQAGESHCYNLTRFARAGVPTDYLLAEDLADNPGDYKLYIFVNVFQYDVRFLAAVNKLKERDCTLLWVYAPGYTFEGKNALENMKKLTGFDFIKAETPLMPAVKLADGRMMGTQTTRIAPMFSVKLSAGMKALGVYEDGTVGYAETKTGKARSIFCGAYQFDVPFLMELARQSGVHIYSESSDPMEANSALFTLHARFPGKKTIRLPKKTDVLDVMNRKLIAKNVNMFTFEAPLHSSWIFYYGNDAEDLLKKLNK